MKPCPFCENIHPEVESGDWVRCVCGANAPYDVWQKRPSNVPRDCPKCNGRGKRWEALYGFGSCPECKGSGTIN